MDRKKLDKWAELLLDTGKRNNLINFKDTKASSVEVLLPSSDKLFETIDRIGELEVFDPELIEKDDYEDSVVPAQQQMKEMKEADASGEKRSFLAQYSDRIKRKNQILLYNASTNSITAVINIDKKVREYIEETGVNVAYMAFGFIHWRESDSSNNVFCAPILLVPIEFNRESLVKPYFIKTTEDDIIVNPTFAYKLNAEFGIKLPDYDNEGLNAYLVKVRNLVAPLQWTVSLECKIGIFSFLKINMYRDLKDNAKAILANRNVGILLGEAVDNDEKNVGRDINASAADPLIELHSVVDADSSQIKAIEMAKSGKSFVLQGPPGTGKSQSITNIIAECLSAGKKVLFVSEKMAALNVVYDKLKQAELAVFCLELHSYKAKKKNVISDICNTLRTERTKVSSRADAEIANKETAMRTLDAYVHELHKQRPVIEKSLYQLYECYAALRSMPELEWTVQELTSKGETYLTEATSLLEQYVDYIPSIGYDFRKNTWYGYINKDTSYQAKIELKKNLTSIVQFLRDIIPLQQEISEKYKIYCHSIQDARNWNSFFEFAATSDILTPLLLNKEQFDAASNGIEELQRLSTDILSSRTVLSAWYDDIYKLDGEACHKQLTSQFSGFFSRLFNPEYKQLITDLCLHNKEGKKLSYADAVSMTQSLAFSQKQRQLYAKAESPIRAFLGTGYKGVDTEWNYVTAQMADLKSILSSGISFEALEGYPDFTTERDSFADYSSRLTTVFESCNEEILQYIRVCFDRLVLNISTASCQLVLERLANCLHEIDRLDNWCHFRNLLSKLNDKNFMPNIYNAITQNIEAGNIVGAFRKQFYCQWIYSILQETPFLSEFNRIQHDKVINTFSDKDSAHFEINKAKIRAELSEKRPIIDVIVPGSPLGILLREGEKKRKQKSIRSLLSETGELVQQIKPCFLMSPLSVSTFLTPESVHFDVVIFDEASQIFPQDAIGAIYRAEQLIVVGDSKQMPPSNFFNASIEAEDNDEETGDVTDFESILDICSTCMPQQRLCWHYRSRYEQLISFSNKNFYENSLITFPSSRKDSPWIGVDYYHVDGVFDRKSHTNRKEAEFIVDLIYQNISKYPNRSLGVVAFSVSQQNLIDKLLSKRRQHTPEKEFFFKNDLNEPFFIKNLETVQGDERDSIIFSIAYGIDAQGRLLHNFGPLNRVGGERRLNVAVSRAKFNIQVVSSMSYTDIDLQRTSAEGIKLLREYLDYAQNGSVALARSISVNTYEQFDSDFEMEVCDFLRSNGFAVDTQVGCSGFRIDLGLKRPDSSDYVLAIECDGATYHSSRNARDRDRLRQQILESMGWKFYRIWSTDWFCNKREERNRLLEVARNAVKNSNTATVSQDKLPTAKFEESVEKKQFEFMAYKAADIPKLEKLHSKDGFQEFIKAILEIEAPLSEELLLRRIVQYFDKKKVTSVVQRAYEFQMYDCQHCGIIRRNGFLYLDNGTDIKFRGPGDIKREIRQIAPEELAAGMREILRQNISVDKDALLHSIAQQCGVNRVGKAHNEILDSALKIIENHLVNNGGSLSLK